MEISVGDVAYLEKQLLTIMRLNKKDRLSLTYRIAEATYDELKGYRKGQEAHKEKSGG